MQKAHVVFHWCMHGVDMATHGLTLMVGLASIMHAGSGKSTVIQLLLRLYTPQSGHITFGSIPYPELDTSFLRRELAVVEQQPVLFNRTFLDNILFGYAPPSGWPSETAKLEAVVTAATLAYAHEFIMDKGGYEMMVTERGANLSGGQRARVAIARVLVRNPSVILLDEATAALDSESEALVQRSLDRALQGRTAVIVAHRMSTIQRANQILVMSRGKVVDAGTHDQLMAKPASLYHTLATPVAAPVVAPPSTETVATEVRRATGAGVVVAPPSPPARRVSTRTLTRKRRGMAS